MTGTQAPPTTCALDRLRMAGIAQFSGEPPRRMPRGAGPSHGRTRAGRRCARGRLRNTRPGLMALADWARSVVRTEPPRCARARAGRPAARRSRSTCAASSRGGDSGDDGPSSPAGDEPGPTPLRQSAGHGAGHPVAPSAGLRRRLRRLRRRLRRTARPVRIGGAR